MARLAGFIPSKRQPLPGNEMMSRGYKELRLMVRTLEAYRGFPSGSRSGGFWRFLLEMDPDINNM